MVLPGWNVSEPIDLAIKLYEVVEALRSAPDSAKAFVSKINNFRSNLKELQRILESDTVSHSADDLENLRATLHQCQACVQRCEEYSEKFGKLIKDGGGRMDGAGQATRWALQDKKVTRLREEIDSQMNGIGLTLAIKAFGDGRRRQSSHSATGSLSPPLRSGTFASLPSYSSIQAPTEVFQDTKTPGDPLGLDNNLTKRTSVTDTFDFHSGSEGIDGKGKSMSPRNSPDALRPLRERIGSSDIDLEGRRNTDDEVAMSPTGLAISSAALEDSRAVSQVSTHPTISSRRTSITTACTNGTSMRDSIISLDSTANELTMENLSGVYASYYIANTRRSYPVSVIESFRDTQTRRRCIIISPPTSHNIRLYFILPTERIIPHSEHPLVPLVHGSKKIKYRVKFIEPYVLKSQKTYSGRQLLDTSSDPSPSFTPVSSAASLASSRSLGPQFLKEESRYQEYDFEDEDAYRKFQELLMGPDVKLELQIPIQSIIIKQYKDGKPTKESKLQYLRLWKAGGSQTLMFFANLSSNKYREYRMENLRPVESRSKTTIRLDTHLPGMIRRRSGSKSPEVIAKASAQEQARSGGYFAENDMSDLDYLLIEFSCVKDRTTFVDGAKFHGSVEESTASPSPPISRFPR